MLRWRSSFHPQQPDDFDDFPTVPITKDFPSDFTVNFKVVGSTNCGNGRVQKGLKLATTKHPCPENFRVSVLLLFAISFSLSQPPFQRLRSVLIIHA